MFTYNLALRIATGKRGGQARALHHHALSGTVKGRFQKTACIGVGPHDPVKGLHLFFGFGSPPTRRKHRIEIDDIGLPPCTSPTKSLATVTRPNPDPFENGLKSRIPSDFGFGTRQSVFQEGKNDRVALDQGDLAALCGEDKAVAAKTRRRVENGGCVRPAPRPHRSCDQLPPAVATLPPIMAGSFMPTRLNTPLKFRPHPLDREALGVGDKQQPRRAGLCGLLQDAPPRPPRQGGQLRAPMEGKLQGGRQRCRRFPARLYCAEHGVDPWRLGCSRLLHPVWFNRSTPKSMR